MSQPSGPDQPEDVSEGDGQETAEQSENLEAPEAVTEAIESDPDHEPATEIMAPAEASTEQAHIERPTERRFTAPSGFDAGTTQKIDTPAEPATEVFASPSDPGDATKIVAPQVIAPRAEVPKPPTQRRSWGWVVAVVLVIAALVAIAVLGTVLLTRDSKSSVSQEDMVRTTIQNFDIAVQNGDLATLRSITCGSARDNYVNYNEREWEQTHDRVAAAKQYPVVASIDQVVINGDHAEANVTAFIANAPQTRSTRSFDLQFVDEQWKICQAPQ
jgi:hypothetical protein